MFQPKFLVRILINALIGVVLIWIWLKFVNIQEILTQLSKVNSISLLPVFFFFFLSSFLRSIRLKIFLSGIKKISLLDLTLLNGASQMLNFFIPIRAGEIAKGVYLNTRYGLHMGKAIIWVFIDRFVDFLVILLAASLLVLLLPTKLPQSFANTSFIIFALSASGTYLAVFQLNLSKKIANFLSNLLIEKHIKRYFERFSNFILQSFTVLDRHPKDLFLMVLLTIAAYATDGAVWYFTFLALGVRVEYIMMYLGQLLSALTYLVPAAPGYIGSAEASGLLILSGVFGIDNNLASSMIVLFHIVTAVFILVFGLISVFYLKLDLGLIFKKVLKKGD